MKRLLLVVTSVAALWSAACGNGGPGVQPPPPTGKFSNASLNGQYAFTTSGEVFAGTAVNQMSRVGSFTADGKGGIMAGGVEDVNTSGVGPSLAIAITGGSYTVNADGRGALTLMLGQNSINFGIVLTSGSNGLSPATDGLMIDETSSSTQASTGSGNFVLQTGPFGSTVPASAGTYVFDFSGLDVSQGPDSIVGEFTVNNGVVSLGAEDENDNGNIPATPTPLSFVGSMTQDGSFPATLGSNGRGIAVLNNIHYVFYIVDPTRIRFLSFTNGMLSGDAVAQPSAPASPSGAFAFIVAGSTGASGVTRVGRFTINGSSMTNVLIDTNNGGMFLPTNSATNTSVTMDAANPGRGVLVFTDPNHSGVPFTFVFYLSSATSGVIQEESQPASSGAIDVADGSIEAQSGGPFTSSNISGAYAFNWSGLSLQNGGSFSVQDEEDVVGQVKVASLAVTGASDSFQFQVGVPVFDEVVSGSIAINGDGTAGDGKRSTMSVKLTKSNSITVNSVVYFVNPQLAFFTNNQDQNRIIAGILKMQQ